MGGATFTLRDEIAMKIIIVGAGELGQLVAGKLCSFNHDVVMIDTRPENLEDAGENLDTRLLVGEGASAETLRNAGAATADLLLALSGDEATNVLACAIAKRLGVKKTVCRVFSKSLFSEEDGVTPSSFHIDEFFSSIDESVEQIHAILQNRILQQKITFQNPDALLDVVNIPLNSALTGVPIKDLPCKDFLKTIRIAAIIRKRDMIVPHGDTVLMPGDKVYVAGRAENVRAFVEWLSKDGSVPIHRVIVAGVSQIGGRLVKRLLGEGIDVRVIEGDPKKAGRLLDALPQNVMLFEGEMTNSDILSEADITECDAFAALSDRDENNILSCLLASRLGAKKVIALTSTAEYMDILPSIEQAGCWFNTTQISANCAFRLMSGGTIRVDPELRALNARITELALSGKSRFVGKQVIDAGLPQNFLIALIIRGDEVLAPTGQTVLQEGDQLIAVANAEDIQKIKQYL